MSLALAPNHSHGFDFGYTNNRLEQNDLEVEEILNELGFYASDEMSGGLFDGYAHPVVSDNMPPAVFAPVSPEHGYMDGMDKDSSGSTVSSFESYERTQTFSVPNPIAAYSLDPSPVPITPKPMSGAKKSATKASKKTIAKKDNSKPRKRKLAETASESKLKPVSPSPVPKGIKEEELTEEQLEERRQRNREHAKRSRQRKKSLTCTLQSSVDELKAENVRLREQIYAIIGEDKVDTILDARREKSRAQFVAGIQHLSSRALDESTLSFLKGLRKNLPAASANKKQRTN